MYHATMPVPVHFCQDAAKQLGHHPASRCLSRTRERGYVVSFCLALTSRSFAFRVQQSGATPWHRFLDARVLFVLLKSQLMSVVQAGRSATTANLRESCLFILPKLKTSVPARSLTENALTTLPAGLFDGLGSLDTL